MGLGTIGGFKLQIEDRAGLGYDALDEAAKAFLAKAAQAPELAGVFSSYQVNVPQLYADIDRTKARQLGVAVTDVFETLQIYLGSIYVNDFNKFGRVYSVRVQADAPFRARADDVGQLKVRSRAGEMVPLATLLQRAAERRAGTRHALQRLPCGRHQRRRRRPAIRPARRRRRSRASQPKRCRKASATNGPSSTYQEILAGNSGALGVPACDPAGVPGARRALREPGAAAVDHLDRADGAARGDHGRLALRAATTTSSRRSA